MADNVVADSGSGGATFATDDISGVHYPITKITIGALDSQTLLTGNSGTVDAGCPRVALASDAAAVTNAGTFAVQVDGNALTALQLIDDIVHVDDTATHTAGTTKGALILAAATPTDGSVDANDLGAIAMSTDRRLHVDAQIVGTDAALDVSGANVTVVGTGTFAVQVDGSALTALQLIDDIVYTDDTDTHSTGTSKGALIMAAATPTDGSVGANDIGAIAMSTDRRMLVDAQIVGTDAALDVSGANVTVVGTGTFVAQVDGDALTALQLIDDIVYTDDTSTHSTGTSKGALFMAAATPTDGSVGANDIGALAMSLDRRLHVDADITAQSAATLTVTDDGSFTLAANSGVDIGDVDVLSQPARDRLTDNVGVALQTDALLNDTTALTPKYAVIDDAASGDNEIVALVASKKIRVLALFMVSAGTVNARFESNAGGTALTGQMNLVANSGFTLPFNPVGWFESSSGQSLSLELSAAVSVDGCVVYVEV